MKILELIKKLGWTELALLCLVEAGLISAFSSLFFPSLWPQVFLGWFAICMTGYGIIKLKKRDKDRND